MNKRFLALLCSLAFFTATAVYASDTIQAGKQVDVDQGRMQDANFVSLLLHGRYSLNYEVVGNHGADTTVIFADGYVDVPDNKDFQKLFLVLLAEQVGDIASKQVEFWSNKELAQAYVTGDYRDDGVDGWLGRNARFGLLTKEGGRVSLSHILSVHERDNITLGKYR